MSEVTKEDLEKAVSAILAVISDVRDQLAAQIDQKTERVETNLLTAFHNWASPVDMRLRKVERNGAEFDERFAMIEARLADLEQGRTGIKP